MIYSENLAAWFITNVVYTYTRLHQIDTFKLVADI